jgi:glycosyltransferase involved in cell wall biosynthesis
MKLLVFAHVPPPYHGQSYAVKMMLESFGGNRRKAAVAAGGANRFGIECYHVNARYSKTLEDIGEFRGGKIFLVVFYSLQAIWCRFRYGVENFYYVPAPGKPVALYRDWLVMLLCRPFFKKIIFHWHAAGLARWLETAVSMRTRSFTYQLMKDADLSIILAGFNRRDAEKLTSRRITVVNAGLPDPCPRFEQDILPRRRARLAERKKIITDGIMPAGAVEAVKVLYLAHCMREKGMFDAVEGVALANEKLAAEKSPLRFKLTLIGAFVSSAEKDELQDLIRRRGLQNAVECLGFVSDERKAQALGDADLFCFPTYYRAESFGAVLVEAMAFGLPIVTTRWRSIPEILPPDYPGLVAPKSPDQIADALLRLSTSDHSELLRGIFVRRFTLERNLAAMAEAIHSVEE